MTDEHEEVRRETPMPGKWLREQREQRGLTLSQVANELHMDQRMLRSLEEDDYSALGAPIFAKGHLRNYARLLGVDPAEVVAEYEAAQRPADPDLIAQRPDGPRMEEHQSSAWVKVLGWFFLLLLAVLLLGWWYYQQEGGRDFASLPPADEDIASRTPRTASPAGPGRDAVTNVEAEDALAADGAEPDEADGDDDAEPRLDVTDERAGVETDVETAGDPAADPADSSQQVPPQSEPARPSAEQPRRQIVPAGRGLVLEFQEESWVEVYDAEGRPILYDLVRAGSRREINATGELNVFLGNADAVDVYVGGETFAHERFRRSDDTARFTVTVPQQGR